MSPSLLVLGATPPASLIPLLSSVSWEGPTSAEALLPLGAYVVLGKHGTEGLTFLPSVNVTLATCHSLDRFSRQGNRLREVR